MSQQNSQSQKQFSAHKFIFLGLIKILVYFLNTQTKKKTKNKKHCGSLHTCLRTLILGR